MLINEKQGTFYSETFSKKTTKKNEVPLKQIRENECLLRYATLILIIFLFFSFQLYRFPPLLPKLLWLHTWQTRKVIN